MSAGNVMLRQRYADLFFSRLAFLDDIIFEWFDAPALIYPEVFNIMDSQRAFENHTAFTGFGMFSPKPEGEKVEYDTILQGFDKQFIHTTYSKGFQISEEGMDDDIDGIITEAAPALGRAAQSSIETQIWSVVNNGFTTETSSDGAALFSNSHPNVAGGTQDNLESGDLSNTNLQNAINKFADLRDDRNLLIDAEATNLIYPYELRWLATELLQSQQKAGTANNDINALNQLGLRQLPVKYLTGATDWYVTIPKERTKYIVYWRKTPVTDSSLDFDTGNMKTKMTYRVSYGVTEWRGWVGGQGT